MTSSLTADGGTDRMHARQRGPRRVEVIFFER